MQNPFEQIFVELAAIREIIGVIRTAPAQQIEVIDRPELRKRLGISEPTAIRYGKQGKIPEIHFGSNVRYNWPAVVQALENPKK
jgi:hypothetical protein